MRKLGIAFVVAACGGGSSTPSDAPIHHIDAAQAIDAKVWMDATPDAGPRGPAAWQLAGVGNGLRWDDTAHKLYLTDDTHDSLVTWSEGGVFATFGTLPAETGGIALGSIVTLVDGSYLTPSSGFGTQGTLFAMTSDGTSSSSITGLDVTRRRAGLAADPSGTLYDTFFVGAGTGVPTGGVASVAIASGAGTETAITTSIALKKVIGLIATATTLYVCDQTAAKIYAVTIADGTTTVYASPPSCDQMSTLPNGDFVTGGLTGGVYRITSAGVVTTIESGFDQVRGTAYDPTNHRLFVIDHNSVPGGHDHLHVLPLDS